MGVEYILSKAVNLPAQFPFWSSVVPQVAWSYAIAASGSVTYTISPTAGSWYIFGSCIVADSKIAINGELNTPVLSYSSFCLSSIVENPNSFTIVATNPSTTSTYDIELHYSAFVLGTKKLRPKMVEKRPKKKPIVTKLPTNVSKLKATNGRIYLVRNKPVYKIEDKVYSTYSDFIEAENLLFLYHLHKHNQKTAIDKVAKRYKVDLNVLEDLYSQHQNNKDLLSLFEKKTKDAKL